MKSERPPPPPPMAWARLRFLVVGGLLACPPPAGALAEAITALAARTWPSPSDPKREVRFGASTIERWYYQARKADDTTKSASAK